MKRGGGIIKVKYHKIERKRERERERKEREREERGDIDREKRRVEVLIVIECCVRPVGAVAKYIRKNN